MARFPVLLYSLRCLSTVILRASIIHYEQVASFGLGSNADFDIRAAIGF
jgi:hypothetical protein